MGEIKNSIKRDIALERAAELKKSIEGYLIKRDKIDKGIEKDAEIKERKKKILEVLGGTEEDWNDYKWQLKNRIDNVEILEKIMKLNEAEKQHIAEVGAKYRWAVSPYYLSIMNFTKKYDPIRLMAIPLHNEIIDEHGMLDPMAEEYTNPAGCITRRYPDRLIINITNECAMYCRFCQRRRNIGQQDTISTTKEIDEAIEYIRENSEIRDVLITGGDTLTLSTDFLEKVLKRLREIKHVEIIRLGTRTLVTMPQRIDDKLCNMLKKYHPIYVNTHFNHPMEITKEAKEACERLANAGVPLGNQAVLLNGVNNNPDIMKCLNQELLKCRVKPYYIFHAKNIKGTSHFVTSVEDGLKIMDELRGFTSGMAIPTYIVNAPKGKGKVPISRDNIVEYGDGYVKIKTWEKEIYKIENQKTKNIKEVR